MIGEQLDPADSLACLQISRLLGWPLAADALSGLSVGAMQQEGVAVMSHLDNLLLDKEMWPSISPDLILQIGGRIISKRTYQFLEWATLRDGGSEWMFLGLTPNRHDSAHCMSRHIQMAPASFADMLTEASIQQS